MPVNDMLNFKFDPIPELDEGSKTYYRDDLAGYTAEQINTACEKAITDFDVTKSDVTAFDRMMQQLGQNRVSLAQAMGIVVPKKRVEPMEGIMVFYVNVGDRGFAEAEAYLFEFDRRYCIVLEGLPENYKLMYVPVRSQPTRLELIKIGEKNGMFKTAILQEESLGLEQYD